MHLLILFLFVCPLVNVYSENIITNKASCRYSFNVNFNSHSFIGTSDISQLLSLLQVKDQIFTQNFIGEISIKNFIHKKSPEFSLSIETPFKVGNINLLWNAGIWHSSASSWHYEKRESNEIIIAYHDEIDQFITHEFKTIEEVEIVWKQKLLGLQSGVLIPIKVNKYLKINAGFMAQVGISYISNLGQWIDHEVGSTNAWDIQKINSYEQVKWMKISKSIIVAPQFLLRYELNLDDFKKGPPLMISLTGTSGYSIIKSGDLNKESSFGKFSIGIVHNIKYNPFSKKEKNYLAPSSVYL